MQQVYASALCNLAATSARNASVGLDFERSRIALAPFELTVPERFWLQGAKQAAIKYLIYPMDTYGFNIVQAPLNQRTWVLQERLLSRRILHFTESGVCWECMSNIASELFPDHLPEWMNKLDDRDFRLQLFDLAEGGVDVIHAIEDLKLKLYDTWISFCETYSATEISNEEDMLVAIHGIAQRMSRLDADRLICGLREHYLLPQLLWYPECTGPDLSVLHWRAPSWSWASQKDYIYHAAHLGCGWGRSTALVENIDFDAHASGQLKHASLRLRGKLLYGTLIALKGARSSKDGWINISQITTHLNCGSQTSQVKLNFLNFLDEKLNDVRGDVLCISIFQDTCGKKRETSGKTHDWELGVLILQPDSSDSTVYRHVGIFLLNKQEREFYMANETPDEHSITII